MAHITKSIEIQAPPARVFDVLDDPMQFPDWMDGVVSVKPLTPQLHGLNTAAEITIKLGPFPFQARTRVVDYKPGYQFTIEGTQGIRGTDTVESLPNGGSRVIWDFDYEIPTVAGKMVDELLFKRFFAASVERSLRNLKEKLEREATTS